MQQAYFLPAWGQNEQSDRGPVIIEGGQPRMLRRSGTSRSSRRWRPSCARAASATHLCSGCPRWAQPGRILLCRPRSLIWPPGGAAPRWCRRGVSLIACQCVFPHACMDAWLVSPIRAHLNAVLVEVGAVIDVLFFCPGHRCLQTSHARGQPAAAAAHQRCFLARTGRRCNWRQTGGRRAQGAPKEATQVLTVPAAMSSLG